MPWHTWYHCMRPQPYRLIILWNTVSWLIWVLMAFSLKRKNRVPTYMVDLLRSNSSMWASDLQVLKGYILHLKTPAFHSILLIITKKWVFQWKNCFHPNRWTMNSWHITNVTIPVTWHINTTQILLYTGDKLFFNCM